MYPDATASGGIIAWFSYTQAPAWNQSHRHLARACGIRAAHRASRPALDHSARHWSPRFPSRRTQLLPFLESRVAISENALVLYLSSHEPKQLVVIW